jgi:hypothetical protein
MAQWARLDTAKDENLRGYWKTNQDISDHTFDQDQDQDQLANDDYRRFSHTPDEPEGGVDSKQSFHVKEVDKTK